MADSAKYIVYSTAHQRPPNPNPGARRAAPIGVGDDHDNVLRGHLFDKDEVDNVVRGYLQQGYQGRNLMVLEVNRVIPLKVELDFGDEEKRKKA